MKPYKGILFSSILLLSTSAIASKGAGYQAPVANVVTPQWEVHAFGGVATLDPDDIVLQVSSIEVDTLSAGNTNSWNSWTATVGVGYLSPLFGAQPNYDGVQWFTVVQPQLNAYYLQGNIDGEVDRFSDLIGTFNDHDYTMEFQSTRLMLDTSLTVMSWRMLSFYAIAGIGVSWNEFSFDADESTCVQEMDRDGNDTNFVWEVGAGINYTFMNNIGVSFQYLFTQFEELELGDNGDEDDAAFDSESNSFNLSSQALMLGLRYAF